MASPYPNPPRFHDMIGRTLYAMLSSKGGLQHLKLLSVEAGGLWVESQSGNEIVLNDLGKDVLPRTLVVLLPWNQFTCIFVPIDLPSLSEKRLGLE